jgi:outer membrane lipoprotein-sorting protein
LLLVAALSLYAATAGAQLLADAQPSEVAQVNALLKRAFEAMARVHDYRGTLIKRELFGDELVEQTIEFKFARPLKVYVKFIDPYTGREGIYVRGSNGNKVRVHKGSFPDLSVSVPPLGRIAMKGNHHPITSFGLERMLTVSARNIQKMIRRGDATLEVSNGVAINDEPAWRITIESKSGGYYVRARHSENLWALAKRVGQDMYVILHHNEDIDSPKDVRPGQRVFVPHYYGSRGEYFFSKRTFMMIKASSWDQRGKLYESYEFPELELNPGLGDQAFDHRNEDYNFGPRDQR